MAAAEQTRYDIKRLHCIFAMASLALLAATIWMLVDDHYRTWKPYQRKANEIDLRLAQWQLLQMSTEDARAERLRLTRRLQQAREAGLDQDLVAQFRSLWLQDAQRRGIPAGLEAFDRAAERLRSRTQSTGGESGRQQVAEDRETLLECMRTMIQQTQFREDRLRSERRAVMADRDAAQALVRLAIRDGLDERILHRRQETVRRLETQLEELTRSYGEIADLRKSLDGLLHQLTRAEAEVNRELENLDRQRKPLEKTIADRRSNFFQDGSLGKRLLELPLLDAFNSPLRIETLWSEGLTQDFNSREVRRFDRCTTCHHRIDKPIGNPSDPLPAASPQSLELVLPAPAVTADELAAGKSSNDSGDTDLVFDRVAARYGLRLSPEGLVSDNEATIESVRPDSPADRAYVGQPHRVPCSAEQIVERQFSPAAAVPAAPPMGLRMGDVIEQVNDQPVTGPRQAAELLLAGGKAQNADSQPTAVSDGQANGAQDGEGLLRLTVRRGLPHPYAAHPRLDLYVGSLSPHPMSEFGCTVCHGGQGSGTDFAWASHTPGSEEQRQQWRRQLDWFDNPDWYYPMLPRRFQQSACLRCHYQVEQLLPSERFPQPPAGQLVRGYQLVKTYGCFGCHEINGFDGRRQVGPDMRLEPAGGADSLPSHGGSSVSLPPGTMRRVGPSLRRVAHKLGPGFLSDWLKDPRHFRPSSRMPLPFGQWRHLGHQDRQLAQTYEAVEIEAMVTYLMERSENFKYLQPANSGTSPAGRVSRGKTLFETSGCLVCHQHQAFPEAVNFRDSGELVQGPDLSAIGDKFSTPEGRQWLYTWIADPARYDPRTLMPTMDLQTTKPAGEGGTAVSDPVEDLVAFLLDESTTGYEAAAIEPADATALDLLTLEFLRSSFHEHRAMEYLRRGIPQSMKASLKPGEVELLVGDDRREQADFALPRRQKLLYVGKQAIANHGCYGCHDIPGFESAKPIGPALTDWGRKEPGQLAFDHVVQYLESQETEPHANRQSPADTSSAPDPFYLWHLKSETRIGFLHQKLLEPRSFDYRALSGKSYNNWLQMPQFVFSEEQREAIMTFVLGLVAQPPAERFIHRPDQRRQALIDGRALMDQYRCTGCHMTRPQQWEIAFPPDSIDPQRSNPAFPFALHAFSEQELAESARPGKDGLLRAVLRGMPLLDDRGQPMIFDDYGDELFEDEQYTTDTLEYAFQLWSPAAIGGRAYQVGESPLFVQAGWIERRLPSEGGFLANYLLPRVIRRERQTNPNAKGSQAWGWLPPPLIHEGAKVQAGWLHNYLLSPYPIRPAAIQRMPRFNLSSDEASKLTAYFAALDDVDYPYEYVVSRQDAYLATAEQQFQQCLATTEVQGMPSATRLETAMKIVTNKNYCVTCHVIGDYDPQTAIREKAPDLSKCYQRLRRDYFRQWLAKPTAVLPYTGMPVNIPFDPEKEHQGGVDQGLFPGSSTEQLDAVVDMFLNFDRFALRPIAPLANPDESSP